MSFSRNSMIEKRKSIASIVVAVAVVLYILSAGGCDFASDENIVSEVNEPHYQRGCDELRRGNPQEALTAFMKVVEKRKDAPESHFELGRLYLREMKDPIFAIYHFRKFLEARPNSSMSGQARQLIESARKLYAATLPESPFENNVRRVELEEMLEKIQKENLELKQKLANAVDKVQKMESQQRVVASNVSRNVASTPSAQQNKSQTTTQMNNNSVSTGVVVARDIPPTYVVQPGDTLSSISKRIYGSSRRWKDIFKANRDRLVSPESVRQGQTLRLPR